MQPDISPELVKSPWIAGAMGALVALHGVPGVSWVERLFNLLAGALIAGYVSPAVAEYFGLQSEQMRMASAFLCGLFGINIFAAVVATLRTSDLRDLLPWSR
jgi:hypothetical protein